MTVRVMVWRTSRCRMALADSGWRASQNITGTSARTASASRTSLAVWVIGPKRLTATMNGRWHCSTSSRTAKESCRRRGPPASGFGGVARAWPATLRRKVVLPEPGPPTTRILAGQGAEPLRPGRCLDSAESIQNSLQKGDVGPGADVAGPVDRDHALVRHVGNQDADDADRELHVGGDLGDRQRLAAQHGDRVRLGRGHVHGLADHGGADQCLDLEVGVARPYTPAGQGIGT